METPGINEGYPGRKGQQIGKLKVVFGFRLKEKGKEEYEKVGGSPRKW